MASSSYCSVGLSATGCEAPPGLRGLSDPIRTVCYACGNPVCRKCSHLRPWFRRAKRARICNDCIENERRS